MNTTPLTDSKCGLLLVALVVPGLACGDGIGPLRDLTLEVAVSQAVVSPSDRVTIAVIVHNPRGRSVSLGDECVPVGFRVMDEKGLRVSPTFNWESRFACIGDIDNTVPAGGSRTYSFFWSPLTNYGAVDAVPLAPGQYHVVAGFAGRTFEAADERRSDD